MFNLGDPVQANLAGAVFEAVIDTEYNDGEYYAVKIPFKGREFNVIVSPERINHIDGVIYIPTLTEEI